MHRLRTTIASVAAVALTAGLAAGAVASDELSDEEMVGVFSIENQTWLLTSQMVDGEMIPVPEPLVISMLMEDGDAGGNGACNNYFTSYELNGFELTFGPVGSTLMGCAQPVMDVEQAYFANLELVTSYQSGGIQMAMLDAQGEFLLEFDLAPEATIVGSWVAQGINNGTGGVESSEYTSTVTADFAADGQLTGFDGCNEYFTTYELDGDSIAIAPEIGGTLMACASPELEQLSQQYYAALQAAATWSVDVAGNLDLRDADGGKQVGYVPTE